MKRAKECLKIIALLMVCVGVPWIGWDLMRVVPAHILDEPKPTFAETVTIVLASVTVVLAVLAITVAVLAVWGYQSIKSEAGAVAEKAVNSTVEDIVKRHVSDRRLITLFRKEMQKTYGRSTADRYSEAFRSENDGATGKIGEEYPGGGGDDGETGRSVHPSSTDEGAH